MNTVVTKARAEARKKFLRFFPKGFFDPTYLAWERNYKWEAHLVWHRDLNRETFAGLLKRRRYEEAAQRAVRLETKTNLLFSFEKMALRDAVKSAAGAKAFANGLFDFVYGNGTMKERFERFADVLALLPRRQTRVLTWPLQTVFGFIGDPKHHMFLKPRVTQLAAERYGFEFDYKPRPNWETYQSLLHFAKEVRDDVKDLKPRDCIDLQSFIWVLGSDEYDE